MIKDILINQLKILEELIQIQMNQLLIHLLQELIIIIQIINNIEIHKCIQN